MQIFVKTLTGTTLTYQVEESCLVSDLKQRIADQEGIVAEEIVLIHGLSTLEDDETLQVYGITEESSINAVMRLLGGKKKRKKKVYTKPKKIGHKHKKRPKALLEYFNVDNTGKISKIKIECEKCPAGTYMADHPDRHTCGRCGNMFYKLTADGKRMPIPKQNKPAAAEKKVDAAPAKGAAKGKKK
ncbi:ubiquitin-40s ribosomal protein s31 fusion protein [Stylonychia lemnae]|uniref:Ubiquitin-40s ribosomal protein s31 fusion protein n=1 Tax=Stylonychia lemnae TaxID=5949 RepID=A0A078B6F1_STYLE|nr:ubiquitin-40s ribosomal protein s31 fusion protein [Stylonychia lemnae]|eukprot:CDW90105.1 ubiquitin-40s ribosomal protein s31 fusion protein [Stylonychia lemnae]